MTLGNKLGKRLEASKRDVVIIQTYRVKLVLAEIPNCDVCQEVSRYVQDFNLFELCHQGSKLLVHQLNVLHAHVAEALKGDYFNQFVFVKKY